MDSKALKDPTIRLPYFLSCHGTNITELLICTMETKMLLVVFQRRSLAVT